MRRQTEEEEFWDEYKDPQSESSSDKSNFDELSLGGRSSNEEKSEVDDARGKIQKKGWKTMMGVQLEVEDHTFKPV